MRERYACSGIKLNLCESDIFTGLSNMVILKFAAL